MKIPHTDVKVTYERLVVTVVMVSANHSITACTLLHHMISGIAQSFPLPVTNDQFARTSGFILQTRYLRLQHCDWKEIFMITAVSLCTIYIGNHCAVSNQQWHRENVLTYGIPRDSVWLCSLVEAVNSRLTT
jgi:hypothetical protein